ncbi:MAG: hypothetical protein V7K67_32240 [Nostoc sp.]|uniref:hypothetical protein n=1 Tax=Nostoc sp. TaxID=1180 RepID=UPI002FF3BF8C
MSGKYGLPYASFKEPDDPGISIFFRIKGQSYAICSDVWDRVKDNLRAITEAIATSPFRFLKAAS